VTLPGFNDGLNNNINDHGDINSSTVCDNLDNINSNNVQTVNLSLLDQQILNDFMDANFFPHDIMKIYLENGRNPLITLIKLLDSQTDKYTASDKVYIMELVSMGFDPNRVIKIFHNCKKNKETTLNTLINTQ